MTFEPVESDLQPHRAMRQSPWRPRRPNGGRSPSRSNRCRRLQLQFLREDSSRHLRQQKLAQLEIKTRRHVDRALLRHFQHAQLLSEEVARLFQSCELGDFYGAIRPVNRRKQRTLLHNLLAKEQPPFAFLTWP